MEVRLDGMLSGSGAVGRLDYMKGGAALLAAAQTTEPQDAPQQSAAGRARSGRLRAAGRRARRRVCEAVSFKIISEVLPEKARLDTAGVIKVNYT